MVSKSNIVASLAQFSSGLGKEPCTDGIRKCLSTLGQVVCQLSEETKLSLMDLLSLLTLTRDCNQGQPGQYKHGE